METLRNNTAMLNAALDAAILGAASSFLVHFSACGSAGKRAKHVERVKRPWLDAVGNVTRLARFEEGYVRLHVGTPVKQIKQVLDDVMDAKSDQPEKWQGAMDRLCQVALPRFTALENWQVFQPADRTRQTLFDALALAATTYFICFKEEASWTCGGLANRLAELPANAVVPPQFMERVYNELYACSNRIADDEHARDFPMLKDYIERTLSALRKLLPATTGV